MLSRRACKLHGRWRENTYDGCRGVVYRRNAFECARKVFAFSFVCLGGWVGDHHFFLRPQASTDLLVLKYLRTLGVRARPCVLLLLLLH